ncbi:MAG: hypothetical protein A2719_04640 [Candidatus Ryanbacteria bacterium RIFCSPHIGHO2_01_FULL_45_22]|uniref:Ig-like domain-containing protein n=1 Tax=Candidatus Ryanbacteria bacterium RIFCSPHIGHO2_01_FULL_45_22 TaxID=1802114 RepID=A0A1G2G212_9BACT|nr:MAG: hypothetical protein A2719_04640 [Candidatus Ryanbacteria bacterium RIFCSPHIGHO2_01_FULL_45_22]
MISVASIKKISALSLCFVFFCGMYANAQLNDANSSTDILLSLSPAYPGPHEQVRVSAQTYSFNIDTTPLTWYVNGKQIKSGKGLTETIITTGSIGTPTTIRVTADPPSATHYDKTLTIWPSDLDVLWYTNTHTPVWYRGKALPVRGSTVTYVALPLLSTGNGYYDPKNLLYEWRIDNTLQKNMSGRGKNTLSLPITKSRNVPPQVLVRVYNENSSVVQEKRIHISVQEPKLLFYELHALRGPSYHKIIADTHKVVSGGETRILAEPYYASAKASFLTYQWNIDSTDIAPDTQNPEILSYVSEAGSSAQQRITLEVTNPFNILEHIQKSFRMHVE